MTSTNPRNYAELVEQVREYERQLGVVDEDKKEPDRRTLVFDVEADNLLPLCTTIHVVCTKVVETGEKRSFRDRDSFVEYVEGLRPTHVCGANILGFDLECLARVWGIPYTVGKMSSWIDIPVVWVDTLLISRFLNADRVGGHSLEAWGERLGFQKGDHSDWSKFSEEMLTYCIRDVDLTERVLEYLEREMEEYG